ncbi:hypothetical protein PR202_gb09040 [Eleusine coracana subsp. coracana]|uniref:RRM domain-containing protein n=1 Tax=Eleusine coracana subsp. coracana TaxID=191504 RepID=A0AAV5EGK7_ELECO|nr:hypothetical protein PR202_gb09040 [Eleusine coracana subsp. coracana]
MARVYVGNLDPRATAREIEDEFRVFGVLKSVWVARKPPGFAFIDFDDRRDAQDAIRELDGKNGWRVELSTKAGSGRGRDRNGGSDMKCYECGEAGHFARELFMSYLEIFELQPTGSFPKEAELQQVAASSCTQYQQVATTSCKELQQDPAATTSCTEFQQVTPCSTKPQQVTSASSCPEL